MSNFLIALLLSAGASGWVYSRAGRHTGGNTKTALITAIACGIGLLIIVLVILGFLNKST